MFEVNNRSPSGEISAQVSADQLVGFIGILRREQEAERSRVANRLHDSLGQTLTVISMHVSSVLDELQSAGLPIPGRLESVARLIDDAIAEAREIAAELRPGILDVSLDAAIEWYAECFQSESGLPCFVDVTMEGRVPDAGRRTEIFRIFEEALLSVSRSVRAALIQVALRVDNENLLLDVEADGEGIPVDQLEEQNIRFLSIRERTARLGGGVVLSDGKSKGAGIGIRIPVSALSAEAHA